MIKIKPLTRFAIQKPNAGLLLFLATIAAIILANTPLGVYYNQFLALPIHLQVGNLTVFSHHGEPMSLLAFVNDALMAVFFFSVGLEIKQEILAGELSSVRKAMLPVVAAFGGMIVPILVYLSIAHHQPEIQGAAIPMATDIAFALAVLGLLGKRVPLSLKIFLTAFAVVDDIGGIIVIALFYSKYVFVTPLLISFVILIILYISSRRGINAKWFYYLWGFVIWTFFLESGIHATIAGVLLAFTVPARQSVKLDEFAKEMKANLELLDFTQVRHSRSADVLSPGQVRLLNNIHDITNRTVCPLQQIIEKLHPVVSYFILPLFAFVNAGIRLEGTELAALMNIPFAIFAGLFVGKTVGIFLFSYLFAKTGLVAIPPGINKKSLFGVSILGGIGFTISLFIANLSFATMPEIGETLLNESKIGIFIGSLVSGVCGYLYLKRILPVSGETEEEKRETSGCSQ
ncbi:MAG: Na+/H+ antiporter NhaA [Tannerella sp.]|nr:Na+/H+ antiporter NhaA [Tannerella sp.]